MIFFLHFSILARAEDSVQAPTARHEKRIPLLHVITKTPDTTLSFLKDAFSKEAIPGWTAIFVSTALTYHYDADIFEGAQKKGRQWGLGNADNTKTVVKSGQYALLRLPSDTGSALYFMGDGWLDFAVAGGFLANGMMTDNNKSYNTALQLVHGMTISAIFVQGLKRSFGRETPGDRSEPRGAWRPFPSSNAFNANQPKYDAMPSGHIMTSTLVFTIIRENYKEYDAYLLPLEIGWLTVLGFQMINNGVHWASDYPLAIGMGYTIGKAAAQLGQPMEVAQSKDWQILPGQSVEGFPILTAQRGF